MTPNYDALQLSPLAVIITVVFYAVIYVWLSFALAQVFKKQGIPRWKAWVPVYSAMTFMKLGGQSVIWVFLAIIPVVSIVSAIFFIFALNGVSKRFGKGPGFTVLGVFFYGIWVSILGFGSAQAVDPNAVPVYEPITKVPYGAPPIAQPPRTTPLGVPISAAPVVASPPPVTAPPVTPLISAAPGFSSPTPTAPSAPPTPPPAPTASVRAPVQPLLLEAGLDDEGAEHTVIVGRRSKQWTLTIDDGEHVRLSGSTVLLGRDPARDPNYPDAQLVPLDDAAKTVSKTHARIELVNGAWTIVDLDSTNGVVLFTHDDEIELQRGVATALTERFLLGELPVRIHQES